MRKLLYVVSGINDALPPDMAVYHGYELIDDAHAEWHRRGGHKHGNFNITLLEVEATEHLRPLREDEVARKESIVWLVKIETAFLRSAISCLMTDDVCLAQRAQTEELANDNLQRLALKAGLAHRNAYVRPYVVIPNGSIKVLSTTILP